MKNFDEKNEAHILEVNRLIDQEEAKMHHNFNIEKEKKEKEYTEPIDEDQERKKEKFKSYLFSEAHKITTPELLTQIVDIIQGSYMDEIRIRNDFINRDGNEENDELIKDDKEANKLEKESEKDSKNSKTKYNVKEPEFIIDEKGIKKYK